MFTWIENLFSLTESTAKTAAVAIFIVLVVVTSVVTRFNLKAILSTAVVGIIVLGIINNTGILKDAGDKTVQEIKNGKTSGLPAWTIQPSRPVIIDVIIDRTV